VVYHGPLFVAGGRGRHHLNCVLRIATSEVRHIGRGYAVYVLLGSVRPASEELCDSLLIPVLSSSMQRGLPCCVYGIDGGAEFEQEPNDEVGMTACSGTIQWCHSD